MIQQWHVDIAFSSPDILKRVEKRQSDVHEVHLLKPIFCLSNSKYLNIYVCVYIYIYTHIFCNVTQYTERSLDVK